MERKIRTAVWGLFMALISTSVAFPAIAAPLPSSTDTVWQHHITAWENRDLAGIVSDYTEDSIVVMGDKTYRGVEQIRQLFAQLFSTFDGAVNHIIDPAFVDGDLVYITWRATLGGIFKQGTDSFFIQNGVIRYQTITAFPALF
jgi:hypothetical protein